jgi:hypothetical protein
MTVIDLQQIKADREAPDADCTERDEYGRPLYTFGIEYELDGDLYTASIIAPSLEEAERHAAAMRNGVTVYGQIYRIIPG